MRVIKDRFARTCRETADDLSRYLEQDLAFPRRRRITRHLRGCIRCRSLLDSLSWTIDQLRKLGGAEVAAPSLAETIVERIRAAEPERASQ